MKQEDKKLLKNVGHRIYALAEEITEILDNGVGSNNFGFVTKLQHDLLYVGEQIENFSMKPENRPNAKPSKFEINDNRALFLNQLRTGDYKKGTIKSDEKGYPVFETEDDHNGKCACAIMGSMFGVTEKGKISLPKAAKALGINSKQCGYIQREINDTDLTFPEMAERIEKEVFNK